ncbi:MAG: GlxA family transcriptional regulator [Gammaproteobacteria bacterium]
MNKESESRHVGFLLLPKFPLIAFGAAIEPLRAANRITGKYLFKWTILSERGHSIKAANDVIINSDKVISTNEMDFDLVMVCSGIDVSSLATPEVLGWLKKLANNGVQLGALSTGAEILARAGLLNGYRCTIHWENEQSFRETYFNARLTGGLFEIDRNRLTAAGGTSSLDLMLHWVMKNHGEDLTCAVAEQFIHDRIRAPSDFQQSIEDQLMRRRSPKLADVIRLMGDNIENPLSPTELAQKVSLTLRQLERLFLKHRNHTPRSYYLEMRLRRARQLIQQTNLSIHDTAVATGFQSQSHFTRCYKELFGNTPSHERYRLKSV